MSRKGKTPITLPKGVEVQVNNDVVVVKGPKGTSQLGLSHGIGITIQGGMLLVTAPDLERETKRFYGLYRSLINNLVIGMSTGFEKKLEMIGVGYRAQVQGQKLDIQIGFSHPTQLEIPKGLQVKVDKNTLIAVLGTDKQAVGQFAAQIRALRPPEPYQGKGIRYEGEYVRKKAGKAAKTAAKVGGA